MISTTGLIQTPTRYGTANGGAIAIDRYNDGTPDQVAGAAVIPGKAVGGFTASDTDNDGTMDAARGALLTRNGYAAFSGSQAADGTRNGQALAVYDPTHDGVPEAGAGAQWQYNASTGGVLVVGNAQGQARTINLPPRPARPV